MSTGSLVNARASHSATLLPNGKVLVAGGVDPAGGATLASAELYDPAEGSWSITGSLNIGRSYHTATLLPNGKVLVAGGSGSLSSAELYDPLTGTWSSTGSLNIGRFAHTATLLPNGKVLVAGGSGSQSSAELYDPLTGTWSSTGGLNIGRSYHTATLLPNGKVLVTGGSGALSSVELYDPTNGAWTVTGDLNGQHYIHAATLLSNGKVLVAGGDTYHAAPGNPELYDSASGTWTRSGIETPRFSFTMTLLSNGKILVAGGESNDGQVTSTELYDVGLGFAQPEWQPQITSATSPLMAAESLVLTGSLFQGLSQASAGGSQDSSTNYPVVQLRRIDNAQIQYLQVDPVVGWSDTSFSSAAVDGFSAGPALVTVFTNGIPSDATYLVVAQAAPTPTPSPSPSIPPTPSPTVTPSPTSTPSITPTPTPSPTATPSPSVTPTPDPSVTPTPTPSPTPPQGAQSQNVSTRMNVRTGDSQAIGGFIITSGDPKKVIIRGLGPSLGDNGITSVLADPTLELHGPDGALLVSNDNWRDTQETAIEATGLAPTDNLESAIVATLQPGAYTVVVSGKDATTGVAMVEIYDLDPSGSSRLANLSTRASVETGEDVVITGFILGVEQIDADIVIRGLGPSLAHYAVSGVLANPTLELRDSEGTLVKSDDDWQDDPAQAFLLTASGLAPDSPLEAALEVSLAAGSYTAILAGNGGTGVGIVEIYNKQ